MYDYHDIKVYDSLTNSIRPFVLKEEGKVSMYVCGPTVYNDIHVGNARPVIVYDTIKKFFDYIGLKTTMVMNFTDIDDKIINKAIKEGVKEEVISERYIEAFLEVSRRLHCDMDVIRPQVTQTIPEIVDFIVALMNKGYAYQTGDDVFFRVRKVKNYGILSNQRIEDLETGARIDVNTDKEDPLDFTLWKKTSDSGKKWDSPYGAGRPGWHTECVVMINKIFGGMIDIHGGGNDLKFPHHENEIAQSMALYDNTIANYWLHNGRIDLGGEKMSKSLGNVVSAKDLLDSYGAEVTRLMVLSSHYRQAINYSDDLMTSASVEWQKIRTTQNSLQRRLELSEVDVNATYQTLPIMDLFLKELGNDFNTSNAFTYLYQLLKEINKDLRSKYIDKTILTSEYQALKDMLKIFGLYVAIEPFTADQKEVVLAWQLARNNKDFAKADELRQKMNNMGITL